MAANQEENLFSGIKFDNEGFLERCQITKRENPKRFDDSLFDENPMNFGGDSLGMGRKINSLDAAIIRCIEAFDRETCGFKTKDTSEAMKDVDDIDNKKVGYTALVSEEWPCDCCNALRDMEEDFLPFRFDIYWKSLCNLVHERKGLEKDSTRAAKDCANTSSPNFPLDLDFSFVRIEDFGSKGHEAKKIGSMLRSKDVTVNNHKDCILAEEALGMRDPLSVEGFSVHNDPLPWRNIHIDHPLSDKITDDDLLRMTDLAQGTLHSLSLVECRKITATCLRRILLTNPGLYEVYVVLKGETMTLNTEGYFGDFTERCPGMRIEASDDSQSEISYEDTGDDLGSLGRVRSQSQVHCEDALLPPTDFLGMESWAADDYPTDPCEFVASVLDWVFN